LAYYINKKNKVTGKNPVAKTPLDLLKESKGKVSSSNLDYNSSITGVFGRAKNLAKKIISIKGLADVAIKRMQNSGFKTSRSDFIRTVLETYLKAAGEKFEENKSIGTNNEEKNFKINENNEEDENDERYKIMPEGSSRNASASANSDLVTFAPNRPSVSRNASASANSDLVTFAPNRPSVSTPATASASRRSSLVLTTGQPN